MAYHRRSKRHWFVRRLVVGALVLMAVAWPVSLYENDGVGFGRSSSLNVELWLARGGVMVVHGGTRTDLVCYDVNTGFTVYSPLGLRIMMLDKAGGPIVWRPYTIRPGPGAGTYLLAPFWMLLVPLLPAAAWLYWPKLRRAGHCAACGYNLRGLGPDSPCPECGAFPKR